MLDDVALNLQTPSPDGAGILAAQRKDIGESRK